MYESTSFIQPMFHLKSNPRPPLFASRVTPSKAVLSSAISSAPGDSRFTAVLSVLKNSIAAKFSRPPNLFGKNCLPSLPKSR